jgi:hypothetical protein
MRNGLICRKLHQVVLSWWVAAQCFPLCMWRSYMFRPLLGHHQAILEVCYLSTLLLYHYIYTDVKTYSRIYLDETALAG